MWQADNRLLFRNWNSSQAGIFFVFSTKLVLHIVRLPKYPHEMFDVMAPPSIYLCYKPELSSYSHVTQFSHMQIPAFISLFQRPASMKLNLLLFGNVHISSVSLMPVCLSVFVMQIRTNGNAVWSIVIRRAIVRWPPATNVNRVRQNAPPVGRLISDER